MRHRLPAVLLLGLALGPSVHAQQPAGPAPVRSPDVAADRRVTFRLAAPKASEVRLTCECVNGPQAMARNDAGVWSITLGPFEPDIYEYEFTVDGVTMIDPRNEKVKYNGRPSTVSSLLDVPGSGPMFYDPKPVAKGTIDIRWYASKAVNGMRRAYVYTPPGYDRGTSRLPVLYLLHGADGDDSAWTAFGRANHILDNLLADKKLAPMVVVMPFGYAYPPAAGAAADRQRADFEKDLLQDLIPFVQANYRVHADRANRALVGLSMGGGQALNIGLRHQDVFSRVASFSGAVPRGAAASSFQDVLADPKKLNANLKLLWIGCGTEDGLFTPNKEFSDLLRKQGVTHTFRETGGAHTWSVWRKYLLEVAPLLFPANGRPSATGA
jgi:enterochelin esterase family protein